MDHRWMRTLLDAGDDGGDDDNSDSDADGDSNDEGDDDDDVEVGGDDDGKRRRKTVYRPVDTRKTPCLSRESSFLAKHVDTKLLLTRPFSLSFSSSFASFSSSLPTSSFPFRSFRRDVVPRNTSLHFCHRKTVTRDTIGFSRRAPRVARNDRDRREQRPRSGFHTRFHRRSIYLSIERSIDRSFDRPSGH